MQYIIYQHTNTITGKSYIGYTGKTIEQRFAEHVRYTTHGSQSHFHRAIRLHGTGCWTSTILHTCDTKEQALLLEQQCVSHHNTLESGYNMTSGGDGGRDRPMSEENKQLFRERQLQFRHSDSSKQMMKEKFTELRGRPVNQYNMDGTFIATYPSTTTAAEMLGNKNLSGAIHQLCAGTFKRWKQVQVNGYQWKFYTGNTDDIPPAEDLDVQRIQKLIANNAARAKKVSQYTIDGEFIAAYAGCGNASRATGVYASGIQRCCKGVLNTAGGYVWKWD